MLFEELMDLLRASIYFALKRQAFDSKQIKSSYFCQNFLTNWLDDIKTLCFVVEVLVCFFNKTATRYMLRRKAKDILVSIFVEVLIYSIMYIFEITYLYSYILCHICK